MNSKTQKGHESCANRKRAMESRAKEFVLFRSDGKSVKEAAKLASISPESAQRALERKYGKVRSN